VKRQLSAKVWIGGTAFVAVLLLVAAWFLVISPVTARAAEDQMAADSQHEQNDLMELEIAKLAEQFTQLDTFRARLAELRLQMPVTGDGASISRELESLAAAAGVTITALAPSVPQVFVPAVAPDATTDAAAPAAEPADAGQGADAEGVDGTAGASADPVGIAGFYAIPISLTSVGSYESSVAFLRSVQVDASRLYLVSSINAVTQDAAGASAGRPATNAGDVEITMTGFAYILTDASMPVPDLTEVAPLPVPSGETNPFQPGR
jgi:Tfp pilus assembly protein PilO